MSMMMVRMMAVKAALVSCNDDMQGTSEKCNE
jgi:hypothetical protein